MMIYRFRRSLDRSSVDDKVKRGQSGPERRVTSRFDRSMLFVVNPATRSAWRGIAALIPVKIMLGLHGMKRFVVLVILAFINQAKGNAGIKKSKADHGHCFS